MHRKRKFLRHFSLIYISVVVPVLAASLFMSYVIFQEMTKMESRTLERQLENVQDTFELLWKEFSDESVLVLSQSELRPDKMQGNPMDTYHGIEILKTKKRFDSRLFSVFLTCGDEKVYSSSGVARMRVYLDSVLGCEEESVERAFQALESGEDTVTFLYRSGTEGMVMYSYKSYRRGEQYASVNFVIPFEQFIRRFPDSYPDQYYEFQAPDESKLVFGRDREGEACVIAPASLESGGRESYAALEKTRGSDGLTLRLWYNRRLFPDGQWLFRIQAVNIVLIIVGIALSAFLSWMFSARQMRQITILENTAKGEGEDFLSQKNIYYDLQRLILQGFSVNQSLEESISGYREELQRKMAHMILSGTVREPEMLEMAFREIGQEIPAGFFVAAANFDGVLAPGGIEELLGTRIWVRTEQGRRQVLLFLAPSEESDEGQLFRRKFAEELRKRMYTQGIKQLCLGMSRIYVNPFLIGCACAEAARTLDEALRKKDVCLCWEEAVRKKSGFLFEEALLEGFDRALARMDYEGAVDSFRQLLQESFSAECTEENEIYLRYMILQHIVSFLQQDSTPEKELLCRECINIRAEKEQDFTDSVMGLLQKCMAQKGNDSFSRILEYVHSNYPDSQLTYEKVAEAGGVGKTYVSKLFRSNMGMSYIEYLTMLRLENACILLKSGDADIAQVAKSVGYGSAASFRRAFKDRYGISASDYRRENRKY